MNDKKPLYVTPMSMVVHGLTSISATFLNMARSPATPEIHKQEFEQAAQSMRNISESMQNSLHMQLLYGDGPVSSAMHAFKTYGFIDPSNRNLDNLAVNTSPVSAEQRDQLGPGMAAKLLNSMLTHRYPKDVFDEDKLYKVPVFAFGTSLGSGIMVTLTLVRDKLEDVLDYCHLEKIVLEYTTVEEFWTVKQEYRRGLIYRQQTAPIEVDHRAEGMILNCKSDSFGGLIELVALTLPAHLERRMNFVFNDYALGSFDTRGLEEVLNTEAGKDGEYRDALFEAVFSKLKRKIGKTDADWGALETPNGVGYRVKVGSYNKTTWAEVRDERKTNHWARDESIFGLERITIAGVDLPVNTPIPNYYREAITEHWNSLICQVIAETPDPTVSDKGPDDQVQPR